MKRRIQNCVDDKKEIQISNGQKFKFSTVKKFLVVNTGEKFSKYFINTPQLLRSPYLINPKSQPRQNMVWGSLSSRMTQGTNQLVSTRRQQTQVYVYVSVYICTYRQQTQVYVYVSVYICTYMQVCKSDLILFVVSYKLTTNVQQLYFVVLFTQLDLFQLIYVLLN